MVNCHELVGLNRTRGACGSGDAKHRVSTGIVRSQKIVLRYS